MYVMLLTHCISLTNVNMILRKGYFGHYTGRASTSYAYADGG